MYSLSEEGWLASLVASNSPVGDFSVISRGAQAVPLSPRMRGVCIQRSATLSGEFGFKNQRIRHQRNTTLLLSPRLRDEF
jgi:hypothetical protein